MSEPTGDGKQQPDPDEDQTQDQVPGSDFPDPTAPVWVDPTEPVPAPPAPTPPAPGTAYPYGEQPAAPPAAPSTPPPVSNPYAQQPPVDNPYGQQPPPQQYAQQYPAYGQQVYATGAPSAPTNTSAIFLTILSALSLCNFLTIASLVLGIIALTKNSTDPEGSRRMTKIGWITFAAVWALAILGLIAFIVGTFSTGSTTNFNSGF